MDPKYIEVWGKFLPRGGISIDPYCNYGKAGTKWEQMAWERLSQHDMYPETIKTDNRTPLYGFAAEFLWGGKRSGMILYSRIE